MFVRVLFVSAILFPTAISYKILGLFPYPGKSHVDVFAPLMRALAEKGHEVLVISYTPWKNSTGNYKNIDLTDSGTQPYVNIIDLEMYYDNSRLGKWLSVIPLDTLGRENCESLHNSKSFQQFVRSNHSFDLIITEFFNTDCFLGVLDRYKAPIIALSSCNILPWINRRYGNPSNPAYVPNVLMDFSDKLTFIERLENTVITLFDIFYYNIIVNSNDERYNEVLFENKQSIGELMKKSSLFLVNMHFSLNFPRPLVPAVVEIGGIHVGITKKLPTDLEKWINESRDGVIYFSLGSMIKGHTFPQEKRIEFLKAFARLPQRVLWKWESDEMPGKPDNVMIQKWMPQLDILCHPNVKAFISHGGLLGTTEAVHCGVPTVVMPQYGDQHTNAKALEANGGGVILQLREASEENVYAALKKVLDPEFRKGAQELSSRFKDRPLPPLETAIYWVEYVARHRGAKHMRTAAVDMPLYQYLLLDVIAFLLVVIGIVSYAIFYLIRAVLRKVFKKSPPKQKSQ